MHVSNIPDDEILQRYNTLMGWKHYKEQEIVSKIADSYKNDFHEDLYYNIIYRVQTVINNNIKNKK